MIKKSLLAYFVILVMLCSAFIIGAKMLGEKGNYLAQGYMMTPAIAALIVRTLFYKPGFRDANLQVGKFGDYFKFWLTSIGISALSYVLYTVLGSISWDFTGQSFLNELSLRLTATGQDINDTLPPGVTPRMMLLLFFIGGLTVFNILPGIITGFGEEFGHRGFMFTQLYSIRPWIGLVIGGLIWYAWHIPLTVVVPQTIKYPFWQTALNFIILAAGSICTFIYLAYVYVKSESIWVASVAHITLNNSAASFSYFAVIQDQLLANLGLTLTMTVVVAVLYYKKELYIFEDYFSRTSFE